MGEGLDAYRAFRREQADFEAIFRAHYAEIARYLAARLGSRDDALDLVVASVHSAFTQDRRHMTDRLLRAIANRYVDVLGHPTGRMMPRREAYAFDVEAIVDAAAKAGMAMEINSQAYRLDLNDSHARMARDRVS